MCSEDTAVQSSIPAEDVVYRMEENGTHEMGGSKDALASCIDKGLCETDSASRTIEALTLISKNEGCVWDV